MTWETGTATSVAENDAEATRQRSHASALPHVAADVIHARTKQPWMDWTVDELVAFVRRHTYAIAPRTFEYQRGGFPLVEVTVPCIHWLDTLGEMRVTTLDYAAADGVCTYCTEEEFEVHGRTEKGRWPDLGDDCTCRGTKVAPVSLRLGVTFMESQQSQWYWHLLGRTE